MLSGRVGGGNAEGDDTENGTKVKSLLSEGGNILLCFDISFYFLIMFTVLHPVISPSSSQIPI
jgi:hypothetical protein